jgi:hypothetical protein
MSFDINDLNALRDEYEERIAKLKKDHGEQLAADRKLRQDFIQAMTLELAEAREEGETRLMDAEKRRAIVEAQLHIARNQHRESLAQLRDIVARSEAELATIRGHLDALLATPATPATSATSATPAPVAAVTPAASAPAAVAPAAVAVGPAPVEHTVDATAQIIESVPAAPASPDAMSSPPKSSAKPGEKKRRIRLR